MVTILFLYYPYILVFSELLGMLRNVGMLRNLLTRSIFEMYVRLFLC